MRNEPAFRLSALPLLGVVLLSSTPGFAAKVPAGTLIENTASASFNTGGATQTIVSNKVTIKVDELLDVAVGSQDAAPVPAKATGVLSFKVTNTGNGPEAFVLTADPAVAGNDFDVTINNLAIDTNDNGVYDPGVDTALANGGPSPLLNPDDAVTIFVLATTPASATDTQTSKVSVFAQAVTGTGAAGTVYPGAGVGGGDAVVGSSGADDAGLGTLISSVVTVGLVKTAIVADPFGGTQPIPGATITYTLVATVSGSGNVDGLVIADPIPASTSYAAGSLKLEGGSLTDAADSDPGDASAAGISVNAGTVAAGSTRTVTFAVKVTQ